MTDTPVAKPAASARPIAPFAVNHIVLNVRDIEESHRFWTEIIGMRQVGALRPTPTRPNPPKMRFYSADHGGEPSHHDIALVEQANLPMIEAGEVNQIHHVALALPNREAWLAQLAFLQEKGIKFDSRVEHGPTHSLYIRDPNGYGVELLYELPREVWAHDIDASVNYYVAKPTEGPAALEDRVEDYPVFAGAAREA